MPPPGIVNRVETAGFINNRVWALPAVTDVPIGTEPDWEVWRFFVPKTVNLVFWFGPVDPYIVVNTSFGGGVATRIKYTYNPARPITVDGGGHLQSFDVPIPYP